MITMGEVMAYLSDPRNARVRDLNEVKRMLADLVVGTSAKAKATASNYELDLVRWLISKVFSRDMYREDLGGFLITNVWWMSLPGYLRKLTGGPRDRGGKGWAVGAESVTDGGWEAYIDIVFDGPPGHESGRFVEVEDPTGKSVNVGDWVQLDGGYWALRIPQPTTGGDCHG